MPVIVKGSQNMLFASIVERLQGLIEEKDFACFIYYIGEEENEVEQAESVCLERHPQGNLSSWEVIWSSSGNGLQDWMCPVCWLPTQQQSYLFRICPVSVQMTLLQQRRRWNI